MPIINVVGILQVVICCQICSIGAAVLCSMEDCPYMKCPNGYRVTPAARNQWGCVESCTCVKTEAVARCPSIDCSHLKCPFGLESDPTGCMTSCLCKLPPSSKTCPKIDCTYLGCPLDLVFDENQCIIACRCSEQPLLPPPCPLPGCSEFQQPGFPNLQPGFPFQPPGKKIKWRLCVFSYAVIHSIKRPYFIIANLTHNTRFC